VQRIKKNIFSQLAIYEQDAEKQNYHFLGEDIFKLVFNSMVK